MNDPITTSPAPEGCPAPTGSDFEPFDLVYALENAAEFLDNEEWPDDDGGKQEAANREAARRIRAMATRYANKNL